MAKIAYGGMAYQQRNIGGIIISMARKA